MSFASLASNVKTQPSIVVSSVNTPINKFIPGRELEQAVNSAGGVSFVSDAWKKLERFLVIGSEGGTYYATGKDLALWGTENTKTLIRENGIRVVDRCVEISNEGRAKNNDYALLVLAMAITHGDVATKRYAALSLPLVARIGTHLFHFIEFATGIRGWGKTLKWAVQNWYSSKTPENVAYQAIKYQQRDGWAQRDILRLSHPKAGKEDILRNNVYKYIVKGYGSLSETDTVPAIVTAFEQAKTADPATLVKLITDYRLSHEMIGNEHKSNPAVWEALYQHMGTSALIRNLNKLTALGLLSPFSGMSKDVITRLTDVALLKKDRIHPMTVLLAQKQYAAGRGDKGSLVWTPDRKIVEALDQTFYSSFQAIEPSGANMMLALDVSASMNSPCIGSTLTCREASAVMAMVTVRVEKNSQVFGFDHKFRDLGITANDSLEAAKAKTLSRNFGSTNCALPMQHAMQQGWDIDSFVVYTDNEVSQGENHPTQALQQYRSKMNKPNAKLISVGMAMNNFTIADPKDFNQFDIVGFDTATPKFISDISYAG